MTIRVTDATHRLIEGWFETERVGAVQLRNYPHPIGLHVVLRQSEAETRLEARIRARPSLVDREQELAMMRAAWNRVVAGERQVVTIKGEAGIGKSRIVEHIIATAAATGAAHVTLACSQLHRESPLRPLPARCGGSSACSRTRAEPTHCGSRRFAHASSSSRT